MFTILLVFCYLDVPLNICVAARLGSCVKKDFYCYYIKGCHGICKRDEPVRNTRHLEDNLIQRSGFIKEMASSSSLDGLYRPRSALARALYEKQRNDRRLQEHDHSEVRYYNFYFTRLKIVLIIYTKATDSDITYTLILLI